MGKVHENQTDKPLGICERPEAFAVRAYLLAFIALLAFWGFVLVANLVAFRIQRGVILQLLEET